MGPFGFQNLNPGGLGVKPAPLHHRHARLLRATAFTLAGATAAGSAVYLHRSGKLQPPRLPQLLPGNLNPTSLNKSQQHQQQGSSGTQQQQQQQGVPFLIPEALAEIICGALGEIVQVAVLYPLDTIKVGVWVVAALFPGSGFLESQQLRMETLHCFPRPQAEVAALDCLFVYLLRVCPVSGGVVRQAIL